MPNIDIAIVSKGAVTGAKKVNSALGSIYKKAKGLTSIFSPMNAAIAGLGGAAAALGVLKIGDEFEIMASQLEFSTGSAEEAAKVEEELYRVSKLTGTSIKDNADSYVKLNQAKKLTNLTSEQNLKVIGGLNALMIKTGTSGVQASAAMLQLSQALTSGKLSGDEFRSMAENAPGVLNKMSEAMGIAREDLKQMSTDGELTSERLGAALLSIAEDGDESFSDLPKTAAKGWNAVVLAFKEAWDQVNDETGYIGKIHDALLWLSTWIEEHTDDLVLWVTSMVTEIQNNMPEILAAISSVWENLKGFIGWLKSEGPTIGGTIKTISNVVITLVGWIDKAIQGWKTLISYFNAGKAGLDAAANKEFLIKGGIEQGHSSADIARATGSTEAEVESQRGNVNVYVQKPMGPNEVATTVNNIETYESKL